MLYAQAHVIYKQELRHIDSIVATGYGEAALEITNNIYSDYRILDSSSSKFKRLSTNYLFILENLDLNEKAIELGSQLLAMKLGNDFDAHIYITFSLIQEKVGNKELANEYLLMAKPLIQNLDNDSLFTVWHIRRASSFRVSDQSDSALFYSEKAYQLSRKSGNKSNLATSSFLRGVLLSDRDSSLKMLIDSYQLFLAVNDIRLGSMQMLNVHAILLESGDTLESNRLLFKAKEIVENSNVDVVKVGLYLDLRAYYKRIGNFPKALDYADSAHIAQINRYVKNDRLKLVAQDFTFKTMRLRQQLNKAEQTTLKREEESKTLVLTLVFILIILFLIIFFAIDQRKKKRLANQNKAKIEAQNQELLKVNKANKLLVKEMNHRLKNNLSTLSALLEIQAQKANDKTVKAELNKSISRIDLLSEVYKKILESEKESKVEVSSIIKELVYAQLTIFDVKEESTEMVLDQLELKAKDTTALVFILNELITNAFKYGERDKTPFVKLFLKKRKDSVDVEVENFGKGIPEDYQISDSSTSGLYIVDLLIKQLGGVLKWKSEEGSFKFYFQFQISND
jgi:two-component sensor histidine kinase